ncbi:tRNA (N6-threonylcarbamoyladenosine(37)-N6)-methyltransferase TrmO [Pseudomonas profundi]|uniref:tRNA (N6-threonylcarbamoyladenosine(37)-N6)-methyltransferase TrmO n=1 Tax=Pseudomonas profundi TaxID=1981513 RepID=UPI00123A0E88|nr:tRNA (N6-threonylcarbamoyladenosine(37)-N6)-methyltransferase TrmO [Pseudomonas profundi]
MSYSFEPVGQVHSCFREKFGIPRQPALAPASQAVIELLPPYHQAEATEGLESVSHIWILFVFHAAPSGEAHLRVRPPRLGGNRKIGVFASRATHRPNPIGQSVVKLDAVEPGRLLISGHDLLHGTPVLDIKPYVPYVDAVAGATNALASAAPGLIEVQWSSEALAQAQEHASRLEQPVVELVEQCLAQDPKPAYQQPGPDRQYGALFWDFNVTWHYPSADRIRVLMLSTASA